MDELTGHLRLNEVLELDAVQYAILETNGSLSVFLQPGERPATAKEAGIQAKKEHLPVTVVQDGKIMKKNLSLVKKDEKWVKKVLQSKNAALQDTFLLTVDKTDKIYWLKKEKKR